jgi:hypothetical protein
MKELGTVNCAICGEPKIHYDGWFLLTENRWTDRWKILAWNESLANAPGVYSACGASHVQQLVVHWMAMGSLEFPFASALNWEPAHERPRAKRTGRSEPNTAGSQVLGELAVHRESLTRILRESPESLASILEALVSALTKTRRPPRTEEEIEDESDIFAMSEA